MAIKKRKKNIYSSGTFFKQDTVYVAGDVPLPINLPRGGPFNPLCPDAGRSICPLKRPPRGRGLPACWMKNLTNNKVNVQLIVEI